MLAPTDFIHHLLKGITMPTVAKKSANVKKNNKKAAGHENGAGAVGPEPIEAAQKMIKTRARLLFDYLKENGAADFKEAMAALDDSGYLPLAAFEAVTDFLEEKGLVEFNSTSQSYSLVPGTDWIDLPDDDVSSVKAVSSEGAATDFLLENYFDEWEIVKALKSANPADALRRMIQTGRGRVSPDGSFSTLIGNISVWVKGKSIQAEPDLIIPDYKFAKLKAEQLAEKSFEQPDRIEKPTLNFNEFKLISIEKISVSQTAPQAERRKRFTGEDLDALSQSIKSKGVLEPIIVRQNGSPESFEIVCGERRFLAAKKAELAHIPSIIRDYDDDAVLEIQLDENLHRVNVHPLDEAVWFKYLEETRGWDIHELEQRVGKSAKYIAGRLKLNNLISEAREDLAQDKLPVTLALEVAKFAADVQPLVLKKCFDYNQNPVSLKYLRESVARDILLNLSSAPFALDSPALHANGLACVNCPERTGARGMLWEEYFDKKHDRCLNRACYDAKLRANVSIVREELTRKAISSGRFPADYQAPLYCYNTRDKNQAEREFGETVLSDDDCSYNAYCESAEEAVHVTFNISQTVKICRDGNCSVHRHSLERKLSRNSANETPEEKAERLAAEERERARTLQKNFDVKIGETVRRRIIREVALRFDENNRILNQSNFDDYEIDLLARLFELQGSDNDDVCTFIVETLGLDAEEFGSYEDFDFYREKVKELDAAQRSRMLFLLLFAWRGEMRENGAWRSQDEITALAKNFGLNYRLIDAEERVEAASKDLQLKKHKAVAIEYFNKVSAGDALTPVPVFFKAEKTEAK